MYKKLLELTVNTAQIAGEALKNKDDIHIDAENGKDIKLSSDKKSEEIIINNLKQTGYSILSEEKGLIENNSEYMWIIDPLDGTANYLKGLNEFTCVSIALWKNDTPILGVIYRPFSNELYYGGQDFGSFHNDKPIKTSNIENISKAFLATGFPVNFDYSDNNLMEYIRNIKRFKKVRMLGAAAIMGTLVATGQIDCYIEDNIMLWDIAAAASIVKFAGGIVDIKENNDYKVNCKFFANEKLMEEYYA